MTPTRRSLKHRISALGAVVTTVAVAIVCAAASVIERRSLDGATVDSLQTLGTMVAINVRAGVDFDDRDNVARFLRLVTELPAIEAVAVYDEAGKTIATAGPQDAVPPPHRRSGPFDDSWLGSVPLRYGDGDAQERTGEVIVRGTGAHIEARMRQVLTAFALAALAVIGAMVWLLRWRLGRDFQPIERLLDTTARVREQGDYGLRAEASGDDEVGQLVRSFNAMLDVIQRHDQELAGNKARLEGEVRERTADLRAAVEVAERATQAKSVFLANMSHEIRTPLNAILGMADLAMDSVDGHEQREYLEIIRGSGHSLLGVLNDILDFSKIESGKLEVAPVATRLESLLVDTLRPLTSRTQSKELELFLFVATELGDSYEVDDLRLRQILTNLVGNAIKFTERGHVSVEVRRIDGDGETEWLEFSVSDTGVGIPPEQIARLFKPFIQADSTITRRFSGTGLGLAISMRLAQLLGGMIDIDSKVGVGSTFRMRLPMRRLLTTTAALPRSLSHRRVLLCSGSEMMARVFASVTDRLDCILARCSPGEELTAVAAQQRPDLVVLDHRDPDIDAQVTAAVPAVGGKRPVLMLTTFRDLGVTMQRCRQHGYAGYLVKPVASEDFAQHALAILEPSSTPAPTVGTDATLAGAKDSPRALRILVAEDNPVNQKLIHRLLVRDGHSVHLAGNGRECIDAFAQQPFDLVLMDMQMPEVSGIEASARIRELERGTGQRIPILALTANAGAEDRDACFRAGMDDILTKPVAVPKLRAAIDHYGARDDAPKAGDHDA